jgi:hypothetical protein
MTNKLLTSLAAIAVGLALFAAAAPASADSGPTTLTITAPETEIHLGDPGATTGSIHQLATQEVPSDLVGATCDVTMSATNNDSIRPDSDLILTSGTSELVLSDIEGAPGTRTTTGTIVAGSDLVLSVRLGPDPEFSAGGTAELSCTAVAPVTVVAPPTQPAEVEGTVVSAPAPAAAPAVVAAPAFTG